MDWELSQDINKCLWDHLHVDKSFLMKKNIAFALFVILSVVISLSGCAASGSVGPPIIAENFPLIDSKLERGVSTKKEVQQLLGTPSGFGAALFPNIKDEQNKILNIPNSKHSANYEVWLYQNIEFITQSSSQISMNQKILLVFFSDELYKGYLWYIGNGVANVK